MADGKVVFEIVGDTKGVNSSVKDVTKAIEEETKKWDGQTSNAMKQMEKSAEKSSGTISSAMEGMVIAISQSIISATASLVGAFAEWATASIEVAASIEQIDGVIDVTFGESGAQRINKWAETAGTQFGLTELQAKKFASEMGVVLKTSGLTSSEVADMSTSLTGLAADMGAFLDMDTDKALNKIKNAMDGNASALKDLGIEMKGAEFDSFYESLGMSGKFSELSQAEQYVVRYQYILEQMSEIQGQYAREVSTYNGTSDQIQTQMARAQEKVGKQLLPVAEQWNADFLEVLKIFTGDNGVAITGTQDQLTNWLEEQTTAAAQARAELDTLADSYSGLSDMEREDYNPEFYGSYGEQVYASLQARLPFTSGTERQMIEEAISAMSEAYGKIGEAETKVSEYQAQLDQLESGAPDTNSIGASLGQGLIDGLASKEGSLQAEVNTINSILSDLGTTTGTPATSSIPSHDTGLGWVPRDNYLAYLHEGEAVLTAEENQLWQMFKRGQQPVSMDYDALGGVMRDNIQAGGNVYLDGRTVGEVISDIQGRTYRSLKRSGWQG